MSLVVIDDRLEGVGGRRGEVILDLGAQGRLIGLDGQQVLGAGVPDGGGDGRVAGDGVDGDDRPLQAVIGAQTLQQDRDGGEFVGFVRDRLLAEHKAPVGGEGGHQMQRRRPDAAVMTAPRRLAVDGDEVGPVGPHLPHPCREAGGEQPGVDPVHQQGQPAAPGNAIVIRQNSAQKRQMRLAPGGDMIVIIAVGDRPAHHKKQNLW
jgi:hypothetical protein